MTERTVEIHTTEEHTVEVCDYCGLDEDEAEGDMLTFTPHDKPSYRGTKLHFHEECVNAGFGDLGRMPSINDVIQHDIIYAADPLVTGITLSGLGLAGAGVLALLTVARDPAEIAAAIVVMLFGGLALTFAHVIMRTLATKGLNEIKDDWWIRNRGEDE